MTKRLIINYFMSPRTQSQWEEIRNKSRGKIIDAATELFAEYGFNAISINDIAKKAGISKGLIYNYFNSKDDLLDSIIFKAFKEFDELFKILNNNTDQPLESLYKILEMTMHSVKNKPQFWKLITGLSYKKQIRDRYASQINERKKKYIKYGSELLNNMNVKNPLSEFLFIGAIIDGISLHILEEPENYPIEMMLEVFKQKMKILYKH